MVGLNVKIPPPTPIPDYKALLETDQMDYTGDLQADLDRICGFKVVAVTPDAFEGSKMNLPPPDKNGHIKLPQPFNFQHQRVSAIEAMPQITDLVNFKIDSTFIHSFGNMISTYTTLVPREMNQTEE